MKRGFLFAWLVGGLLLFVFLIYRTPKTTNRSGITAPTPTTRPSPDDSGRPTNAANSSTATTYTSPVSPVTKKTATIREPEFSAFASWAERRLAGDPTADLMIGEALAWKRREAMLELMETDPARALALAIPELGLGGGFCIALAAAALVQAAVIRLVHGRRAAAGGTGSA